MHSVSRSKRWRVKWDSNLSNLSGSFAAYCILLLNLLQADAAKAKVEREAAAKAQVLSDPLLRGLHQRAKKMLEGQRDTSLMWLMRRLLVVDLYLIQTRQFLYLSETACIWTFRPCSWFCLDKLESKFSLALSQTPVNQGMAAWTPMVFVSTGNAKRYTTPFPCFLFSLQIQRDWKQAGKIWKLVDGFSMSECLLVLVFVIG